MKQSTVQDIRTHYMDALSLICVGLVDSYNVIFIHFFASLLVLSHRDFIRFFFCLLVSWRPINDFIMSAASILRIH